MKMTMRFCQSAGWYNRVMKIEEGRDSRQGLREFAWRIIAGAVGLLAQAIQEIFKNPQLDL